MTEADPALLHRLGEELLALLRPAAVASLRITHNRRLIIGLRGSPRTGLRLGIHAGLVVQRQVWPAIAAWISGRERRPPPLLQQAIDAVFAANQDLRKEPGPDLEPLAGSVDLSGMLAQVQNTWFPHLSMPAIAWGRSAPRRQRRHIRFACYRRAPPAIIVNPLIDQPWVARRFVEYLLFHELCHHAQACRPLAGETAHSARFQAWERRYPHRAAAVAWEKANLDRFLAAP